MDKGIRSEDAFRPPPGLVSLAAVIEGAAPFIDMSSGVTPGVIEDHMKVSSCCCAPCSRYGHLMSAPPFF